jgi:seryl-tRNA synthetase
VSVAHLSAALDPLLNRGRARQTACDWDECFQQLALASGATEFPVAEVVPAQALASIGYFEAFPDTAVWASASECFQPAVCYHCYLQLENTVIQEPLGFTCRGRCRRNETSAGTGRLREFTMREVVFFGEQSWLAEKRQQWMEAVRDLACRYRIPSSLEAATDPFFPAFGSGRGKKLLQQIKGLKYELRADIGEALPLALASFNLHETFFGRHFQIKFPDGRAAASACFAFGLERWVIAGERAAGGLHHDL